jgi:membrane dipeptidase
MSRLRYPGNDISRNLAGFWAGLRAELPLVIGVIPFCRFLNYGWKPIDGRDGLTLATLSNHIDHICQIAGDASHAGIGSDFDGGFGKDSAPADVDSIADLQELVPILVARGYTEEDIIAILGGNWLRHLQENLPHT